MLTAWPRPLLPSPPSSRSCAAATGPSSTSTSSRPSRVLNREDDEADALLAGLRERARAEGLWAPHVPPEAGGTGQGFLAYALLNEEIGRSIWAQLVFGCQAPDAGNAEILHLFGTDEQKERYLRPLVAGEVRSFFSMTEPEVAGSDPTTLRTRAVRDGDEWVIDGHKWFSSGADGAGFGIVMAVTDPDAESHRRASQILVDADTPGVEVVRADPGHRPRAGEAGTRTARSATRACACRSTTCSASRATASASRRSASARAGSTTSCAGSARCSAPSS